MKLFETKIDRDDILNKIVPVLEAGELGFGPNVIEVEKIFKTFSKKEYNIAVNSASAAAFMIFAFLKEKYGACDVYTSSIGFTSPAWAAKHFGHKLIWVEVDENLLFDVEDYKKKRKISCERYTDSNIKPVLMPILYGGVSNIVGFDTLKEDGYNEIVVVDAAHCATPTIKSDFTFFSFHPYKPIAASDGGMISTDDKKAGEYFKAYRNFGRKNIEGGYDIVMNGFKFYMNNLNATITLTQINKYQNNLEKRKINHKLLEGIKLKGRLLPHDNNSSYYFATLICDKDSVEELTRKYPTSKHYPLLHKTEFYNDGTILKNTEEIHKYILNLPLYGNFYNS